MNTVLKLDPIISEFDTQAEADSYDVWFMGKVQEALDSKKKPIPHDEVVTRITSKLAERSVNAG